MSTTDFKIYMGIILPNRVVKLVLLFILKGLSPVLLIFITKDPTIIILGLKYLNASFRYHNEVYLEHPLITHMINVSRYNTSLLYPLFVSYLLKVILVAFII